MMTSNCLSDVSSDPFFSVGCHVYGTQFYRSVLQDNFWKRIAANKTAVTLIYLCKIDPA